MSTRGTKSRFDLGGAASRLLAWLGITRRKKTLYIDLSFSVELERVEFDLSGATTPEKLREALAAHITMPPDWRDMWRPIIEYISYQERPYTGRHIYIHGWHEFATHMPRYAKRLQRGFDQYARWHPHVLVVEYL